MYQSAISPSDISQAQASYNLRLFADKIKPLYSIMTGEEEFISSSGKRSSSYDPPTKTDRTKIFALSEVQTPNFSNYNAYTPDKNATKKERVAWIRFSQINNGFRHLNDALKHINKSNEKTLAYLMRGYDPTGHPFSLQENSFFNDKKKAVLYHKKNRSTTPTPRESRRKLSGPITPEKIKPETPKEEPPKIERKEKAPIRTFSKVVRNIHNVPPKINNILPEEAIDKKSFENSVEKSIEKNSSQRSSSVPILPKGSLMTLYYMKGMSQARSELLNGSGTASAKSMTRTFYGNDFDTSSFAKWSERERENHSSVGRLTSERQTTMNGFVDENGQSFSSNVIYTEEQHQVLPDRDFGRPKSPLETQPFTFKKGNRAYKNTRKQYNSKEDERISLKMQVIEEEKNGLSRSNSLNKLTFPTEKRFKQRTFSQSDERKWLEKKGCENEGAVSTPTEMRSSCHNMFRFKNALEGRRRRKGVQTYC